MCTAKQLSPSGGGIGYKNNPKRPVHLIPLHLHHQPTPPYQNLQSNGELGND